MNGETVIESAALVKVEDHELVRPADILAMGAEQAKPLADFIKQQKLSVRISGREYVRAEGWVCLARMNGVVPREIQVDRLEDGTYIATVALIRVSDQRELTRASAECGMDEPAWANRPNYARRSMAITRATAKACRIGYSWVIAMSGYEPTPFEEVEHLKLDEPRPAIAPAPRPVSVTAEVVGSPDMEIEGDGPKRYVKNWEDFLEKDEGIEYMTVCPGGFKAGTAWPQLSEKDLQYFIDSANKRLAQKPDRKAAAILNAATREQRVRRDRGGEIPF